MAKAKINNHNNTKNNNNQANHIFITWKLKQQKILFLLFLK